MPMEGQTAVITGAGSGFGRAFATACAARGMKLVLADIQAEGLDATRALPELANTAVLTQVCDVARAESVEALAQAAEDRFGAVHLLFNNAGVAVSGPLWTATLDEWNWALGINLMGVVHGIRSFVPRMLKHGGAGHIVNTASAAGLTCPAGNGIYVVSKHGVVAMSEVLYHELKMTGSKLGVSVLCPAFAPTGIANPERLRPAGMQVNPHPMAETIAQQARKAVSKGKLSADDIARITLEAVDTRRFYVLPHEAIKLGIEGRMKHLLEGQAPHDPFSVKAW